MAPALISRRREALQVRASVQAAAKQTEMRGVGSEVPS